MCRLILLTLTYSLLLTYNLTLGLLLLAVSLWYSVLLLPGITL